MTKRFGERAALAEASLELRQGEIHALVGANGAGKSTLAWLLAGRFHDYSGEILVDDVVVTLTSRRRSLQNGIQIVTQEPALIDNLPVANNLFLGDEGGDRGGSAAFTRRTLHIEAKNLLSEFGLDISPERTPSTLTLPERQGVDLVRAAVRNPRFLIVDEPPITARQPLAAFFRRTVERLRREGCGVLLVTHHIAEVLAFADRVTVLRNGCAVESLAADRATAAQLSRFMFGEALIAHAEPVQASRQTAASSRRCSVHWEDTATGEAHDAVLEDRRVTGIKSDPIDLGGDLVRAAAGASKSFAAQVEVSGQRVTITSPRDARQCGVAYLPADRQSEGVFENLTVADNMTFAGLEHLSMFGIINRRRQRAQAEALAAQLGIDPERLGDRCGDLSGGNQQKTVLARIIAAGAQLTLFDEPNRGVDLESSERFEAQLRSLAQASRWALISSTDEDFLQRACSYILHLPKLHEHQPGPAPK